MTMKQAKAVATAVILVMVIAYTAGVLLGVGIGRFECTGLMQ